MVVILDTRYGLLRKHEYSSHTNKFKYSCQECSKNFVDKVKFDCHPQGKIIKV
jgi:predicted SprT family Zn-dependent metalloprotease